ncbi:unnamed protein product [Arctogadus glacialis]
MTGSWRLFLLCILLQGAGCTGKYEILMPASVTTLSGSCVTLPCKFTVVDVHKDKLLPGCGKCWLKADKHKGSTTFRGNLTAYDCTTTFNNVHEDNVQYYFRIQCGNFKYGFSNNLVTIRIKELPDAPSLTTPKEPVVEGTPVELRCSAPSYCDTHPPTVTWTPALGLSTQLQQDDTVTSTLTFNASHLHHGNNVSCTAAYYIPSGNKTVTSTRYQLSISYAPRNTSAVGSPCLPAREGGCLNLTCSSHANPAVSEFTWYRIHGEHILKIGRGSSLSVQLWNANYVFFCEARNEIGTEKSDVFEIDIQDAPRNTSAVGSPCLPAREGGCLNLTCTSHANPAVSEVTWYRIHGEHILKIGTGSPLSIQLSNSSNVFFCEVRNVFGTEKSTVYKIDIQTPPRILPSSGCSRIAAWVRCSCDSVGRPSPSLEWRLDGKLVLGSEDVSVSQVNLENTMLRSSITMRAPAGLTALTCHSSNAAGNTSQELPVPHLETQPTLTDAPRNTSAVGSPCLPAREGGCLNLTCTSHANPAVSEVTWYRIHGEHILKIGTGSSLSIQLWNANNVFFCEARNDFGTEKSNVYKIYIQTPSQIFNIPDLVLCIGKSAVIFVGLVCVIVCIIRTRKVGEETRSFNAATVKRAPPDEEESQVVIRSEEDDYVNSGMQMNPVGPREEPVGPREEAVLRAGSPVSTHRDAASSRLKGPAGSHPGRPVSRELTEDTQ